MRTTNVLLPVLSVSQENQEQRERRKGVNKNYRKGNYKNNNRRQGGGLNEFGQLNQRITQQETAQDVLGVLASTKGALSSVAGGGKMSTVNFSTSIHRIARHLTLYTSKNKPGNDRAQILSDPRFALLICSMSEAMLDGAEKYDHNYKHNRNSESLSGKVFFGGRELSNVVWAIAKLKIAPPDSVVAVDIDNAEALLREKSGTLRSLIFDIAKERASPGSSSGSSPSSWIPDLSELCGLLVDTVSAKALELDPKRFQQQELSNLMWALATTQRPSESVFEYVVSSIIASAEERKRVKLCNENNPNNHSFGNEKGAVPQEWSIPLWVLAKSGTDLGHEEELLPFVNDMMDNEPGFLERFKPQELSNSVWAAATIISKRDQAAKGAASDAALGILRHTSRELIRRDGERYKTQELANSAWAMATLGFGIKANTISTAAKGCHLTHTYTHLISDDPEGDRALMAEAIKITFQRTKENLSQFTSQELNNLCWVMARLDEKDEELIAMIGKELANPRKRVNSQDLSTSLWSMATMEYCNEELYRSIVARFPSIGAHGFKPQELSNTVWALATAGVIPIYTTVFDDKLLPDDLRPTMKEAMNDPITSIFTAAASELIRRPHEFKVR